MWNFRFDWLAGLNVAGLLTIKKMINSLNHRGPDDNGILKDKDNRIFFGYNRLSKLIVKWKAAHDF